MDPAEATVRFSELITDMDKDKDGFVSREELTSWVYASFMWVSSSILDIRFLWDGSEHLDRQKTKHVCHFVNIASID